MGRYIFFAAPVAFSENGSYEAAPAFDTPEQAIAYYENATAQQQRDAAHASRAYSENGDYVVAP